MLRFETIKQAQEMNTITNNQENYIKKTKIYNIGVLWHLFLK